MDLVNQIENAGEADEVFEALHAVMHLVRAHRRRAMRDGPYGLTPMEGRVLGFFSRHPGATQSDLAAHTGRDKSQLARLVAGLRERGLLEARVDEDDRRNLRLHPTPAARAAQRTLKRGDRRLAGVAVAGLSEEERRQLVALLVRVRGNLESAG